MMSTLRVATYNVGNAAAAKVAADLQRLDDRDVDVIGVQEVGDRAGVLRRSGRKVLRKARGHKNKVGLLLRPGAVVARWDVTKISSTTPVERTVAGAKRDGKAEAKFIAWADVAGVRVGTVHLVPSTAARRDGRWRHPRARTLYLRQVAGCVKWFRDGGDVLLGDFNGSPDYGLLAALREVAVCHFKPSHGNRSIDHVWVRKGSDITVDQVRALDGFSSDHRPVVADLTIRKDTPMVKPKPPSPPVIGGHPKRHSGTGNHPITRVVIHSAVMPCEPGRARQLGEWNRAGTTGGSWHYSVDPEETFQCSWDSYVCWHAPPNGKSIGIEMADHPGPLPNAKPGSARWKAAKSSWRWVKPSQRKMLRRTARLTAHLLAAYDLPPKFLKPKDLRAGRKGVTIHYNVSRAFGQSSHWDPGFWPRRWFMRMVRRHYKELTTP